VNSDLLTLRVERRGETGRRGEGETGEIMGEREGDERSGGDEGGEGGRELGYFVCQQPVKGGGSESGEGEGETGEISHNALCYAWDASTFPWLMTWEENYGRDAAPWSTSKQGRGRDGEKERENTKEVGRRGT
jgi:hypothetical protein